MEYRFLSEEDFKRLLDEGRFLEHACVHGYRYATLREDVERVLDEGKDIILEIDVQGLLQVREALPEAFSSSSPRPLRKSSNGVAGRGTEKEEVILLRLKNARWEMEHREAYDHVIENDDADRASSL